MPDGNEIKEFISSRNGTKWSYIEFAKQIYRTSESEYIAKYGASKPFGSSRKKDIIRQRIMSFFQLNSPDDELNVLRTLNYFVAKLTFGQL